MSYTFVVKFDNKGEIKMRFNNLEAEIKRTGLSVENVASELNLERATFYNRLNGKTKWTLGDMLKVQKFINFKTSQQLSLDYLFKVEN